MYKNDKKDETEKAMPPAMLAAIEAKKKKEGGKDGDEKEEKAKKAKDEKDDMDKSMTVSEEELEKSIAQLEELAKSGQAGRKQELLSKAMNGDVSEDETRELRRLLKGKGPKSVAEEISKSMEPSSNETFAKSLDVSDYLGELHKSVTDSLTAVAESVEKSASQSEDRVHALAKAMLDISKLSIQNAKLLKGISQRLGVIAQQPARAPRGAGVPGAQPQQTGSLIGQPFEKGMGGQPQQVQLSKSDVLDTLETLMSKSIANGGDGMSQFSGENYGESIAKYEMTNSISPAMLKEVVANRRAAGSRQ